MISKYFQHIISTEPSVLYRSWNKVVSAWHKNNSKFRDCENRHNEALYTCRFKYIYDALRGLMVAEQIKNYPHFTKCQTLLACTYIYKRPPLGCVFSQISSAHTRHTCVRHITTFSSHLYQGPWNGLTSWGFPTKLFLCISLLRVVCPIKLSSLKWWINNVLFNVVCKYEGSHTWLSASFC